MQDSNCTNILKFLHEVESLKYELRHSWTSSGRQESVADHSWRLALMIILCAPYLKRKIDLLKALKMAIIHDIGESKIGDKHFLEIAKSENSKKNRYKSEFIAVKKLIEILKDSNHTIFELWEEFENRNSYEAKVVYALDKLEVCVQHNEANISTWTEQEMLSIEDYFNELEISDDFLIKFKNKIKEETFKKLKK